MRLGAFFTAYALNSAGIVNDSTLHEAAGLDRRTARSYATLLSDLGVIAELPAWSTNRLKRLARGPKRYVADTGLWGAAVGADAAVAMSDGHLLGRLIDTFVTNQLRAEAILDPSRPKLHHLRDRDGRHEVDLVADLGARGLVGIEIKAHSAPKPADARHLVWASRRTRRPLQGRRAAAHRPARYRLGDRIEAIPICTLWS